MAKVAIGSDHAGFELKSFLIEELKRRGHEVQDCGTNSPEPVDYPAFCFAVGEAVAGGRADWGIVLGGSGQGEQIAANKVRAVRAALCPTPEYARLAREHNDANVLAMGGRMVEPDLAVQILETWISTPFGGGRHERRVQQIENYESGRR